MAPRAELTGPLAGLTDMEVLRGAAAFFSHPDNKINPVMAATLMNSASGNSFTTMFNPTKKKVFTAMSQLQGDNSAPTALTPKTTTSGKRKGAADADETPSKRKTTATEPATPAPKRKAVAKKEPEASSKLNPAKIDELETPTKPKTAAKNLKTPTKDAKLAPSDNETSEKIIVKPRQKKSKATVSEHESDGEQLKSELNSAADTGAEKAVDHANHGIKFEESP